MILIEFLRNPITDKYIQILNVFLRFIFIYESDDHFSVQFDTNEPKSSLKLKY